MPHDNLKKYHEKRDFAQTNEPQGSQPSTTSQPLFVVQQHHARTLHYDFRLEVDGVLKSWAVPKGPSTNPRDKRLAVPTEDHPLEYARFEGVIPPGQYGAGPVMVWDIGHYRNLLEEKAPDEARSMTDALEQGHLEIYLKGQKLCGAFALFRTKGRDPRWLLVKMKDEHANKQTDIGQPDAASALTSRTIQQIQQQPAP